MRIDRLRLKGFIGIKKGLGLDEVEIDFHGRHGVIAFCGDNGAGKTTVLECLHPYPEMVSRTRTLKNHVLGRDAERELHFTYHDQQYRSLIRIDAKTGKSEGYLWSAGQPLCDGKISTYSEKVIELFGSSDVFFNSVFTAQGAKSLTDMTKGARKELFAEILGLNRLRQQEQACRQIVARLQTRDDALSGQTKRLDEARANLTYVRLRVSELIGQLNLERGKIESKEKDMLAIDQRVESLKASRVEQAGKSAELKALRSVIEDYKSRRLPEQKKKAGLKSSEYQARIAQLERALACLPSMTGLEIQAEQNHIEAALKRLNAELYESDQLQGRRQQAETNQQTAQAALRRHQDAVTARAKELEQRRRRIVERMALLTSRDPACQSESCSFIVDGLKAKTDLGEIEQEISEHTQDQDLKLLEAELIEHQRIAKVEWDDASKLLSAINVSEIRNGINQNETRRNQLAQLSAMVAVTGEKQSQIVQARQDQTAHEAETNAAQAKLYDELSDLIIRDGDLAQAIDETLEARLAQAQAEQIRVHFEHSALNGAIAKMDAELAVNLDRGQQLNIELEKGTVLVGQVARLKLDIADWSFLRRMCGKGELQTAEIESAAPCITAYANELLNECFGQRFGIRFETVREDGAEVFDVIVYDDRTQTEQPIDLVSGGEEVVIMKVLRLSVALMLKERSGRQYTTVFADEEDGALSHDRKLAFVDMHRSMMRKGQFDACIMISHTPEVIEVADEALRFGDGKIEWVAR